MRHARPAPFSAVTICLAILGLGAGQAVAATAPHGVASHASRAGDMPAEVTPAGVESIATAQTFDGLLHMLDIDVLAVDMFLKIEGIDGEATAGRGHEDWIEIESFSWGESRTLGTGRARDRSQTAFSDVSVVKDVDAASPDLYQACANGKHYPTATLVVRKAGEPFDYFSIRLQDVRISSVKISHAKEREVPMEEITLNYGKITWSYDPQGEAGGKVEKGWDLMANKGA